jgi:CRP/FNR family cyclic AMP-dependent transcriptional regulator
MTSIDVFKKETNFLLFEANQVIFEVGQHGDCMYAIIEGQVEVSVNGHVLDVVGPGSIVGEMALIDAGPRSATARAQTACKLVQVDQKRFSFLVQQTPFFAIQVMRIMSERLRHTSSVATQ